ncbi:MAG: ATP-binding protein [Candidatus Competibacteraceae bacterium]
MTGTALPGNSPVFFGRESILHEILATLRRPDKPGCVSLLGERRIGKSSLLNQVYQALGKEAGLVTIHATAQNWNQESQQSFFARLQQVIALAVELKIQDQVHDYPGLRDFIASLVQDHNYRFVLILDEFDAMAGNPNFNADFFVNLRALSDRPEYRFGYLVSSHHPLKDLCREHKIDSSAFWNIFGFPRVVGLLLPREARDLVVIPFNCSLPPEKRPELESLWQNDIMPLTGYHPALIQMVAAAYWNAKEGGYDPNPLAITMGVREYLKDFWYQRSKEESGILIRAAAGHTPISGPLVAELVERGLLTLDQKPFSDFFSEVITESIPKGKSVSEAAEDVEKKMGRFNKLLEQIVKVAEACGKVYRAFKGSGGDNGKESKS